MDDEIRYNNRQIERMLDSQSQDLKEHMEKTIQPLVTQVTRTNGRVTELERRGFEQNGFNRAIGVSLGIAIPLLLSAIGWALYEITQIPQTVQSQFQTALSEHETIK